MHKLNKTHTSALIRFIPQVFHGIINFFHFKTVIFHDGTVETNETPKANLQDQGLLIKSLGILLQIAVRHVRHLGSQKSKRNVQRMLNQLYLHPDELFGVFLVDVFELLKITFQGP